MSVKRSRPGNPEVRKGKNFGPEYPDDRAQNPWNAGVDRQYGLGNTSKSLNSPSANTIEACDLPMHDNYNKLFEDGE